MFLKNGFGKMNITSFNNAHLATDLKSKQNNMWQRNYYNPSLIANDENENVDNSIDSGLNDDLLEKDKNTGLQQKDNKLDNHDKKPNNKNNFFKNNSNSKGDVLKKLFGKKGNIKLNVFSLKTKLILCGIGGGVFLLFIILLTLFTSNNGADLDLVNNYKEQAPSKSDSSNIDVGSVVIGTDGLMPLTVSIVDAIGMDNYNKLNETVMAAASSNGCSKTSMANVASTLAKELGNYGYRVPYYWGGGHSGIFYMGVDKTIGAPTSTSCSDTNCYSHVGYDCSGFVSWAATMVLGKSVSMITNGFMDVSSPISFAEAGAGDILVSVNHIVLVLQNNGGTLLTIESAGNNVGVIFGTYDQARINSAGLQIKSMSNYFATNC